MDENNILDGDYKKLIIETDEKNPITIANIQNGSVELKEGYRIRMLPKENYPLGGNGSLP